MSKEVRKTTMGDKNRPCSNEAMEKIIGNMTAEMQNLDGQYVPLGFTHVPPAAESLNWTQQPNTYINHYNVHSPEPHINYSPIDQYPQQSFNFIPQPNLYETNTNNKNMSSLSDYDMYKPLQNGTSDMGLFDSDYRVILPQNIQRQMVNPIPDHHILHHHQEPPPQHVSNRTQLIENLVGNWMMPNNSGTYSPFGNSETYKPNVFDLQPDRDVGVNVMHQIIDEPKFKPPTEQPLDDIQFQFNRDTKKPRMVAEVKPMRPSYSDVLTKPVPQSVNNKPQKNDVKEPKPKKENKKNPKSDKSQKIYRNTNNDIKEIPTEKNSTHTKSDKTKLSKSNQLSRKWASLDNISDPQVNKNDDSKKKKNDDIAYNKNLSKPNNRKINKTVSDVTELNLDNNKTETLNVSKNGLKKINKPIARPKVNDSFGNSERPPGKRNQRSRKRENHVPFGNNTNLPQKPNESLGKS
ncbi:hypothetical protein NQ318_008241 [Aromia moschata]|uniref:Enamelin n=1 Tax=Aromia moschata TaxID=1265417 RepID=A0AAV8Y609_9CUCU|nr:hypothetical protein NQ318_008241 [Aromia moschata]